MYRIFNCAFSVNFSVNFFSVLVRRDSNGKAQLVLLDHGLYDYLNVKDRVNLCQLYKAIIMHNDLQMKYYSMQLGVTGNLYKSANQSVS